MKINKKLIGKRIRLRREVERFPDFIAWENSTGVIDNVDKYQIVTKMDEPIDGAEHWHNCIIWQDQHLADFEQDVEILEDEPVAVIERFNPNI
jgi:hypothetical protein